MDFEDFEKKMIENRIKLFILCSPHNPVGRVWNKEELIRIGDLCMKYGVIVVSDEIHLDFIYKANLWLDDGTMFGSEGKGFQRMNIACPRIILKKALLQLEKAVKDL